MESNWHIVSQDANPIPETTNGLKSDFLLTSLCKLSWTVFDSRWQLVRELPRDSLSIFPQPFLNAIRNAASPPHRVFAETQP